MSVFLEDEDGNRENEREFDLCPEHLGVLLHRVLTVGRAPFDDVGVG